MEIFKELSEAWSQRIRNPVFGSVIISFFLLNWKPVWFLLFSDASVIAKFQYVDANSDIHSLLIYPLLFGLIAAFVLPWIKLLGLYAVRAPTSLLKRIQHDDHQDHRIYQLERSAIEIEVQARVEAAREQSKIDAAKRLQEARDVGSTELLDEITEIRSEDLDKKASARLVFAKTMDEFEIDIVCLASTNGDRILMHEFGGKVVVELEDDIIGPIGENTKTKLKTFLDRLGEIDAFNSNNGSIDQKFIAAALAGKTVSEIEKNADDVVSYLKGNSSQA